MESGADCGDRDVCLCDNLTSPAAKVFPLCDNLTSPAAKVFRRAARIGDIAHGRCTDTRLRGTAGVG